MAFYKNRRSNILKEYFDQSTNSMCLIGFEGEILRANDALLKIAKVSLEEVKEVTFFDFVSDDEKELLRKEFNQVIKRSVSTFDRRLKCQFLDEEVEMFWTMYLNDTYQTITCIGYNINSIISEEVERENLLLKYMNLAESPLNKMYASLLEINKKPKGLSENELVLRKEIMELKRLFFSLRETISMESSEFELKESLFDFREMINGIFQNFLFVANQKGVTLNLIFDEDIPQFLFGDGERLELALGQLIKNAFDHVQDGKILLKVRLIQKNVDSVGVQFDIQDNGIGIKGRDLERLFDKRKFDARSSNQNLGVGLFLVHKIITKMNGIIRLNSTPQVGTSIRFNVRLGRVDDYQFDTLPADQIFIGRKFLVVEDNQINAHVIDSIIKQYGGESKVVHNGLECLELLSFQTYDLIIMDAHMPVLAGKDTLQIMREELKCDTPVIVCSVDEFDEMTHAVDLNISGVMRKPFDRETFINLTKKVFFNTPLLEEIWEEADEQDEKIAEEQTIEPIAESESVELDFEFPANKDKIQELTEEYGIELLMGILSIFTKAASDSFIKLKVFIINQEMLEFTTEIHSLMGTLSTLRMNEEIEQLRELRTNYKKYSIKERKVMLEKVEKKVNELVDFLTVSDSDS